MMKKILKRSLLLMLVMMLVMCMTSCGNDEIKSAGEEIVNNTLAAKDKKIVKVFNEDDDDYDINVELVQSLFESFSDEVKVSKLKPEITKAKVDASKDAASIDYTIDINDEEYSYELALTKDGDNWIISDNYDYMINTIELYIEIILEEGDDSEAEDIEDMMDEMDFDDYFELAEYMYDDMYEFTKNHADYDDVSYDDVDDFYGPVDYADGPDIYVVEPTIIDMTMFIDFPGNELDYDNEVQEIIANLTGVRVKETYLVGQTSAEAINSIIAAGAYPDFIYSTDEMLTLYDAGALVAWDDYLDIYPNIKELYTAEEWDKIRADDGHIYWAPVFNNTYGLSKETSHNESAFWIQARVLEWAGYPNIETVDEYFQLLSDYVEENPTMPDGEDIIPFTTLCDDWRNFCLTTPPMFLAGYPDNGEVAVDTSAKEPTVFDYSVTETAEEYYRQLNQAYKDGILDPDFSTQTYDEYITKLSTGRVLGMFDQYWDFYYSVDYSFTSKDLYDLGCGYIPLGLTIDQGMTNYYHNYTDTLNYYGGLGVTTSCVNPDIAFSFINDLLAQDVHDLRFWGVCNVDYLVDSDGMYYRTEDMRDNANDSSYIESHLCSYMYFPQWRGTSRDGNNAMQPSEQASEFLSTLPESTARCLEAYGAGGYCDMIGSVIEDRESWAPLYTYTNAMSSATPGGQALYDIKDLKSTELPKVVMAKDFDKSWNAYITAYNKCNPDAFIEEVQEELDRRIEEEN